MRNMFCVSGTILLLAMLWTGCDSDIRTEPPAFRVDLLSPTPGPEPTQVSPGEMVAVRATITNAENVDYYDIILSYGAGADATKWRFPLTESTRAPIVEVDNVVTIPPSSQPSSSVGYYTLQFIAVADIEGFAVRAKFDVVSTR